MSRAEMEQRLRATAADLLAQTEVPGAAIAMMADGQLLLAAGVGYQDLGRVQPLAPDAPFYAYSISKIFLAVAALRLAEHGRLDLDAPVQTILPELPLKTPVTIRQLLNHTGGLPDYGAMPAYKTDVQTDPGHPWSDQQFIERTLNQGLLFPPGQGWAYSNVGFLLIRQMIARLTHTPAKMALAELVFTPAGLHQTVLAETLADTSVLTPGYSIMLDQDGVLHDITRRYHPGWVSHGVAISIAPELVRFLHLLFAGHLLQPASLAAMLTPVEVPGNQPPFDRPAYGLGLMIDRGTRYGQVAGHIGEGPGYSLAAFHLSNVAGKPLTIAALANRDRPSMGLDLVFALAAAYRPHPGLRPTLS